MSATTQVLDAPLRRERQRDSPYQGLMPFHESDSEYFFGRESWVEIIEDHLLAYRITVFYGASGVGKSSVLYAGVLSHLRELTRRNLDAGEAPEFVVVVFDSWNERDLIASLKESIRASVEALSPALASEPPSGQLADVTKAWAARVGGRVLFILDQFEEYFIYHSQDSDEESVDDQLAAMLSRRDLPANFLISIREDALATLDRFDERVPTLLQTLLRLEHMDRDNASEAIRGPIDRWNELEAAGSETFAMEPALVEEVLKQVEAGRVVMGRASAGAVEEANSVDADLGSIETPYLQMVMTRLWAEERRVGSPTLRLKTLEDLGGAEAIVRARFRVALDSLSQRERDVAAEAFQLLVTPSGGKIALSASELASEANVAEAELKPILERLSEQDVRLLRPVSGQSETRYEIFHDVLARPVLEWRAEVRARRREKQKLKKRLIALLPVAFLVLAGLTAWAFVERGRARDEQQRAESGEAAARALLQLARRHPDALRIAVQAMHKAATPETGRALREVLAAIRLQAVLRTHTGAVSSAAFSPDGALVVTAGADGTAQIWDVDSAARHGPPLRHGAAVAAVAFSPNGRRVVTAGADGKALLWDVGTATQTLLLRGPALTDAAFSPDGKLVVVARTGGAQIVDVETATRRGSALPHPGVVNAAAFSPDGKLVVTASANGTARIWDVKTGAQRGQTLRHGTPVRDAVFSPDGKLVVTAGGGTVRIWDVGTGAAPRRSLLHGAGVNSAAFSPDGKLLITAGDDGRALIWDVKTGRQEGSPLGQNAVVNDAAFSPDGRLVVTAGEDGRALIFRVSNKIGDLPGDMTDVADAAFSADGKFLVTAGFDGAQVWDVKTARPRGSPLRHDGVVSVALSPDGRLVITAGADGTARIWDVRTAPQPVALLRHGSVVYSAAFSPDGKLLVTGSDDGSAQIWDVKTARPRGPPLVHEGVVSAAAFSSDGRLVVTAGADTVRIWDVGTATQQGAPLPHQGGVSDAAFSPDGKLLVTEANGKAQIWEERAEAPHGEPIPDVMDAAFSPDSSLVATVHTNGSAQVWDARSGTRLLAPIRLGRGLTFAAFSPDARLLITVSNGVASIYRCDECLPVAELLAVADSILERTSAPEGQ